jgi:hypothetical protein
MILASVVVCIMGTCGTSPVTYDDSEVGKAMTICAKHEQQPAMVYSEGGTPMDYAEGWEACYKVREKWNKTETARQWREQQDQEAHEQEFVKGVAAKPE